MDMQPEHAQSAGPGLRFDRLTMDHGLSQNAILCLLQDRYGFVWLGSQDGLNCYDGNSCRIYRHEAGNSLTLSGSDINSLFEDAAGTLWVGTFNRGLSRYDRRRDVFEPFKLWTHHSDAEIETPHKLRILAICECPEKILWLGTTKGLLRVNSVTGEYRLLRFYKGEDRFKHKNNRLRSLHSLPEQQALLAGTEFGLWFVDVHSCQARKIEYASDAAESGSDDLWVTGMWPDNAQKLWMCTHQRLFNISLPTLKVTPIPVELNVQGKDTPPGMTSLAMSDANTLWITSLQGLIRFDIESQKFQVYRSEAGNPYSMPHNISEDCILDKAGSIWCATRAGVGIIHLAPAGLELYDPFVLENSGMASHYVNAFAEDHMGNLWIGSGAGLYRRARASGKIIRVGNAPSNQLVNQDILSLWSDAKFAEPHILWVGSQWGVDCVNTNTLVVNNVIGATERDVRGNHQLNHRVINNMLRSSAGDLYFGTQGGGLNVKYHNREVYGLFKRSEDNPKSLGDDRILSLAEDRHGNIWVGTFAGVNCFSPPGKTITRYLQGEGADADTAPVVLDIHEDARGRLWFATTNGLFLLVNVPAVPSQSVKFTVFTRRDGLPNEVLYGIEEDEDGNLWVSSNGGLLRIRYEDARFQLRVYDRSDNAQDDEFNLNAHVRLNDGSLVFGGPGGFNIVRPKELRDNQFVPPLVFTDLKVFNKSVALRGVDANADGFQLDTHINESRRITLTYRESVFSVEFAALNFIKPERNHYAYKLEGFDADWIDAGNRNFATYTNLDAGDYVFRVRASNNDGIWNRDGAKLHIRITPPPWKTWWAYSAYASAGLASILAYTRARVAEQTRQIEAQNAIERAKVEERENMRRKNAADFHDEAGNKLTKIMLYTELVKRNAARPQKVNELMEKIESNATALSSGMRDFIWVLDPARDTLSDTVARLQDFGAGLFQDAAVDFAVDVDQLQIHGERLALEVRRELLLIFKEAMHNTLKYARCSRALLSVRLQASILTLAFVDDGVGFDTEQTGAGSSIGGGYGLGNMRSRAAKIGAQFVIKSAADAGTAVAISLKLPQMGN